MTPRLIKTAVATALALTSLSALAGEFGAFGVKNRSLSERGIIIVGGKSPGDAVSLNPQPLPPRTVRRRISLGDDVMLNPQPLPPKVFSGIGGVGDKVALNPQPLPPRTLMLRRR